MKVQNQRRPHEVLDSKATGIHYDLLSFLVKNLILIFQLFGSDSINTCY